MKKIVLISFLGLIAASCGTTEDFIDEVSDDLNIPDRIASGRAKAYAYNLEHTDSTLSQIDYQYYTPQFSSGVMDSTYKDSVNARIAELASMESPEFETQLLGPLTDYYFERVVNDFTVDEEDDSNDMNMYQWSMEMAFDIDESKEYVVLSTNAWSYTGGAHGNGYSFYEYFSKKTGVEFGIEYFAIEMDALLTIAEKKFRSQQDIEEGVSLDEAGFWFEDDSFHLSQNFYFRGDELVFLYNSYEIAPYAAGVIELTIPLEELEGIVRY
ncbi:MAG: hypothetical protein Crog4KO_00830 [Crocinitomicaceae bacterium]